MKNITLIALLLLTPAYNLAGESSSSSSSSSASTPTNYHLREVERLYLGVEKTHQQHEHANKELNALLALLPDNGKTLLAALAAQQNSKAEKESAESLFTSHISQNQPFALAGYQRNVRVYTQDITELQSKEDISEESQKELANKQRLKKESEIARDKIIEAIAAGKAKLEQLKAKK